MASELKIDEWMQIGRHNLINEENGHETCHTNDPDRLRRKLTAVPFFKRRRQPVDDHSNKNDKEYVPISGNDIWNHTKIHVKEYLSKHGCSGKKFRGDIMGLIESYP